MPIFFSKVLISTSHW